MFRHGYHTHATEMVINSNLDAQVAVQMTLRGNGATQWTGLCLIEPYYVFHLC